MISQCSVEVKVFHHAQMDMYYKTKKHPFYVWDYHVWLWVHSPGSSHIFYTYIIRSRQRVGHLGHGVPVVSAPSEHDCSLISLLRIWAWIFSMNLETLSTISIWSPAFINLIINPVTWLRVQKKKKLSISGTSGPGLPTTAQDNWVNSHS